MKRVWKQRRKRIFEIIEVGTQYDYISREYDILNTASIILNLVVSILYTYDQFRIPYGTLLLFLERMTILFFFLDYILRLWTSKLLYPRLSQSQALKKYIFFIYRNC